MNEFRIALYKDCILDTDWTALIVYDNCETINTTLMNLKMYMTMYFQSSKTKNDIEIESHGSPQV